MSRRKRNLIIAGIAVIGVAIAGGIWFWRAAPRPSSADIATHLAGTLAPLPVRVAALDLTYGPAGSAGCLVTYRAQIATTEPLVRRLDTAEYLHAHAATEMAAIDAAAPFVAANQSPGATDQGLLASRIAAAVGAPAPTPSLRDNTGNNSVTLLLRAEGGRLIGADGRFAYEFEKGGVAAPSGGSVDQRLGGSAQTVAGGALRPDGSASAVGARSPRDASAPSAPQSDFSIPAFQSFSVSTPSGAFVYSDGVWLRLPKNNARAVQNTPQKLTGFLQNLGSFQDRLAGKTSAASTTEIGEIRFDGIETVPVIPAKDVVIVYVGPLTPFTADDVTRYPELNDYPKMELAPEKTLSSGIRYASLYRVANGFLGFGTSRVITATVETASANLTVFRATAPLTSGRYALSCGTDAYEVAVE